MSFHKTPSIMRLAAAIAGLVVVLGSTGLLIRMNESAREAKIEGGSATGKARVGAPFNLVDTNGRAVSDRDFHGRFVLLMFVRAADGERTAAVLQIASAGLEQIDARRRRRIAPVLVVIPEPPVEPGTSGAAAIEPPMPALPTGWTGLSGAYHDVVALARAYHVPLEQQAGATTRGAPPASSVVALLLDERGAFRNHLVMPNDPTALAQWVERNL